MKQKSSTCNNQVAHIDGHVLLVFWIWDCNRKTTCVISKNIGTLFSVQNIVSHTSRERQKKPQVIHHHK